MHLPPELSPDVIHHVAEQISPWVVKTPIFDWHTPELSELLSPDTSLQIKLELFQHTNSFKPRGALNVILHADKDKLKNGIVAASGGNHGIAVAYAAKTLGHQAKIVIPLAASPLRRARCEYYGAEVIPAENLGHALQLAEEIQNAEGRLFVHPFEGIYTEQGTATVAAEWVEQTRYAPLDAIIIPVGGGGLIAGMGSYFKQVWPDVKIYGAEPMGAPTLYQALKRGRPVQLDKINTIADSLAVPQARPYSFGIIQRVVDEIVLLSDDDMRHAMHRLFNDMKLVTEPASAAGLAALTGPLRKRLLGKRVGIIACGSNLDIAVFAREVFRAEME
jgi:threonine dehydratase